MVYRENAKPEPENREGRAMLDSFYRSYVDRVSKVDQGVVGIVKGAVATAVVTGSISFAGATMGGMMFALSARYLLDARNGLTGFGAGLVKSMDEAKEHNTEAYRLRLERMLDHSDIAKDDLSRVPPRFVQPLIFDYAVNQYNLHKDDDRKPVGRLECDPEIRLRESLKASAELDQIYLMQYADHLLDNQDIEMLRRLWFAVDKNGQVIETMGRSYLDEIVDNGSEDEILRVATYFPFFDHWDGLKRLYDVLLDENLDISAQEVAMSIKPIHEQDATLGASQECIGVLFGVLMEREEYEQAENVISLMRLESQKVYRGNLDFTLKRAAMNEKELGLVVKQCSEEQAA